MLNRDNILDIIKDFEDKMEHLERELENITDENVRDVIKDRLANLADNKFRHELQAKAWGLMDDDEEEEKTNKHIENIREEIGGHIGILCIENGHVLTNFCMCPGSTGYIYCAEIDGYTISGVIDPFSSMEKMACDIWDDINDHPYQI